MITKQLKDLTEDIKVYEEKLNNCETPEEIKVLKSEFLNILKLYLFEANKLIKETFNTEITPFIKEPGYNALYTDNVNSITRKTKNDFFNDIDNLTNSSIYNSINDEQKILVNNAFYVLKNYYEDSLN